MNKSGSTALMKASQNGHIEVVNLLLKYKANAEIKNHRDFTVLMLAAAEGHYEIVDILLSHSDGPNKTSSEALKQACVRGNLKIV